jgi:VCBS repeat-containing protein
MPVTLSRVRSINLQVDNDSDGYADAADVIRTTLVITNTGTSNATNLLVNDPISGTTFFGVVNISPLAFNESFTAVGNTVLRVGGASNIGSGPSSQVLGNLLNNDIGSVSASDGVPGFTLNAVSNLDTAHGTANIFSDGSFNYISDAGYEGADSFTYVIHDAGLDGISGNSDDLTSIGTVSITVTGQVWYVDSAAAPGSGNGTSTNPFGSLSSATAADSSGDYIYVKGSVTGTATLETTEHLIGTGSSLDVNGFHLADAGSRSTISGSSGFTITLAGGGSTPNNEIAGINIVSTGGAGNGGITGTSFGQLSISNVTVDASGQALGLTTGSIVGTGLVSTDSDSGANNVALTGVTGTLALGTGALSNAAGSSFLVSGGSVTTTYSGNITQANNAALLDVQGGHTGTLTFSTGTLSATNGTGLQFNNADGSYNLNGTNTMNGGDAGVDITNGSNGGFVFSTNSSITNPTGIAFLVSGAGAGNIDYNGTISKTSDGKAIDVSGHTGGTISFDGTVSSTGSSDGILLATNTGAIINFTNTLTINTSASNTTGFAATGGGTVTASGSGNTINSGQGTALNVSNTNIGAADMIFTSINSSGGTATGIILDTTGAAGGLHVIGTGSAGSGGTIASKTGLDGSNTTGVGIYLNSTAEVFLDRMQLNNFDNFGIRGFNVNGFTLANSTVNTTSGLNGNTDSADEGSVAFGDFNNAALSGLTGTVNITNSVIANSFENNFRVVNHAGSMVFNMSGSTIRDTRTVGPGNEGLLLQAEGSANMTVDIETSSFLRNRANGIHVINQSTGTISVNIGNPGVAGSGGTFTDNTVGINLNQNDSGTFNFNILNATLTVPNFPGLYGAGGASSQININMGGAAVPVQRGGFIGNIIGNSINMNGSQTGPGMQIIAVGTDNDGGNVVTVLIDSNTIANVANYGLLVQSGDGNATINATITSNTISTVTSLALQAIRVDAGVTSSQAGATGVPDNGTINLDLRLNNLTTDPASGLTDIRIRQRFNTIFRLEGYGGSATDMTAVQNFLIAQNPGNTAAADRNNTGFQNIVAVTMPPAPLMALTPPPPAPESANDGKPKDSGTGGEFTPPPPADPGAPPPPADPGSAPPAPVAVVDDGVISQPELNLIVDAAIQRWADAGATADEIAAMRAVEVTVEQLAGLNLGSSDAGHIIVDDNAAGFNWFIDATPGEDSEYAAGEHGLTAVPGTVAASRVDLLTTIMHELGHQIGLTDTYAQGDNGELMYGYVNPGERRLPDAGDVAGATGTPVDGTDFALAPVGVGTLLPGQTVTIQWDATVDPHSNQVMPTFSNVSTITGNDGASPINVTSNANTLSLAGPNTSINIALDTLTLGGTIWLDNGAGGGTINNGVQDGTEAGITGVSLSLFADADNNNVADGAAIATFVTLAGGAYSFAGLAPGNYLVTVDAANFTGGGALVNRVTAPGTDDPDDNDNNDDNGIFGGGAVSSLSITLAQDTEPTQDASLKFDINNTLDFGFVPLNQAPVNAVPGTQTINEDASRVFNAVNGNLISISDVDAGTGNMTVTLTVIHGTLTPTTGGGAVIGNSGTATVTINGTLTQVNAALNGLSYAPTGDFNGSDTLTVATSDNGNVGADPGNTGGANDEQDSDPITINITAVNDAPTVIGGTTQSSTTILEDQPLAAGQSVTSLFGTHFSDAADQVAGGSTANTLAGIAVTANGSSGATGQWQYSTNGGGSWQDIGAVADATARLYNAGTLIRFRPTLDYNGAEPTLTVHLVDSSGAAITDNALVNLSGGGATGGTTRYSGGIVDLGGSITAVNDAPLNGVPLAQTINEDATRVFSSIGGNAITVGDVDLGAGDLKVTLSVVHGTLALGGIAGLDFDVGTGTGGETTMTFRGTVAEINAALNGLTYTPTGDFNGSDTLSITTNDQGNSGADPGGADPLSEQDADTVTINITPVNDAPVRTGDGTEDAAPIFQDNPTGGQSVNTLFSGQYSDAADNQIPFGGASSPGAFTGIAVVANGSAPATGQWQYLNGAVWTDMGAVSTASALLIAEGTMIRFNPAAGFAGTAPTLTAHLIDNSGAAITMGQHVDISAVGATGGTTRYSTDTVVLSEEVQTAGALPVIDLDSTDGGGINDSNLYVEGTPNSGIGEAIGITDADGTTLARATVTITDAVAGDELLPPGSLPAGIAVDPSSTATTLILIGTASLAAYEDALGQVGYRNTSQDPTFGGTDTTRTITVVVNDGTLNSNPAATMTMTIIGINDEPTLTAVAQNPTFAEDGAAVDLFTTPITASTIEANQTFTSLTLTVTNVTDGASEVLNIDGSNLALTDLNNVPSTATNNLSVSVSVTGTTATITFSGATLSAAQLQTLVDTLTYANTSQNPTDADRVVTITTLVDSGSNVPDNDNTTALNLTSTVNVNPVNDAATITGTITGDVTEAGGISNGTAGVHTASADLGATDPDNAADAWQAVAPGAATVSGYGTYALTAAGVWTYTLNETNAAVQALNVGGSLADTFSALTADGTSQLITITIHGQDDAPTPQPDAVTTNEATMLNGNVITANGSGPDSDPDSGGAVTVSAVNGSTLAVGTQITLATGAKLTLNADGTFLYDPNHAFDATPAPTSGAANTPRLDTFDYTLTGGGSTTVTVTVTGVDSNDTLLGTSGADTLTAGIGNDYIDGGAGADGMYGGTGNDIYVIDNVGDFTVEAASEGIDRAFTTISYALIAGSEVEILSARDNAGTGALDLFGNELGNELWGNEGVNFLSGGAGNDVLIGFGGDDTLLGGTGADYLDGGAGADALFGSENGDTLLGRAGNDYLDGGTGVDGMYGGTGDDSYFFDDAGDFAIEAVSEGNDRAFTTVSYALTAGSEIEILSARDNAGTGALDLFGNELGNELWGNEGVNFLSGGAGNDALIGYGGDDLLVGGQGADYLDGGSGADDLLGSEGDDLLLGRAGNDYLDGGTGVDGMYGGTGDDIYFFDTVGDYAIEAASEGQDIAYTIVSHGLVAGSEIETLSALDNHSTNALDLSGNELANALWGNDGANLMSGAAGDDQLIGYGGDDTLLGGTGNDYLAGGLGADLFVFTTPLGAGNVDTIADFVSVDDTIVLDHNVFAGLGLGPLGAGAFVIGTAAADADDRIIYDVTTGALLYDADGNGAGAAVQFATMAGSPLLVPSDFVVV